MSANTAITAGGSNLSKRPLWVLASLIVVSVLVWRFPLFHVVSLRQAQKQQQNTAFDAAATARAFWQDKILPASEHGIGLTELWKALATDPTAARKKFGHSPGISSVTCFLIQGSGKISKVEKDAVQLTLDSSNPELMELSTSLVFGNAVRDCTGLLNGSDFANSQDFNNISAELNHIVETEVIPPLRRMATPGKTVRFGGCIELDDGDLPKVPRLIPIKVSSE